MGCTLPDARGPRKGALLRAGERADGAARQVAERERADPDADEPADLDAGRGEHAAHVAVAPLVQDELEPSAAFGEAQNAGLRGGESVALGGLEAGRQPREERVVRADVDLDVVGLGHVRGRGEQGVRPPRVVGEEEEPFARAVEAADRRDELGEFDGEEGVDAWRAALGDARDDDAARLVEREVAPRGGAHALAVEGDRVAARVDAEGGVGGGATVDAHAARRDPAFGVAARTGPELGEGARERDAVAAGGTALGAPAAGALAALGRGDAVITCPGRARARRPAAFPTMHHPVSPADPDAESPDPAAATDAAAFVLPSIETGHASALLEAADAMSSDELDALPYGMIQLDASGRILRYNAVESRLASLPQERAVGRQFFTEVAPCTKVQQFYGRFKDGVVRESLDVAFEFHFAFKQAPRDVTVRLFYSRRTRSVWVMISDRQAARAAA